MFLISQKEDVDRHLAICNYLYFINPYICGADRLIRWHLIRILDISPRNPIAIREWIFGIYNGNPDCPFSNIELMEYKKVLNELQDEFK